MSIFSKLHHVRYVVAVSLLLPLLSACSSSDSSEEIPLPLGDKYINLKVVVSSGSEGTMRGTPEGDEDGDGREAGQIRENTVTGVTLMLFVDENGINSTTPTTTKLAYSKYFPVTLESGETYTTGDQPFDVTGLDLTEKYQALVVANVNMVGVLKAGTEIGTVRDYVWSQVYDGTGLGVDASNFVMSSETGYQFDFSSPTSITKVGNKTIYNFDGIRIERLAARVDFWTKNATYATDAAYTTYSRVLGYEYPVWKAADVGAPSSSDKFVLTAITPFNLYTDGEYLFKRTNDATDNYLADETTTNYVIDPNTNAGKTAVSPSFYNNTLDYLLGLDETNYTLSNATKYYNSCANLKADTYGQKAGFSGAGTYDNFILCYPKENTLLTTAPLYYYATGVAIEGDYYKDGNLAHDPKHLIYYGYLRHQGEGTEPYIIKDRAGLNTSKSATYSSPAMNYGVVRNNIYRISIDKITEKGDLELIITVKKWDTFTHSWIYM